VLYIINVGNRLRYAWDGA